MAAPSELLKTDHGPWRTAALCRVEPPALAQGRASLMCLSTGEFIRRKTEVYDPQGGRLCDLKIPSGVINVITSGEMEREGNSHLGMGHDLQVKDPIVLARETVFLARETVFTSSLPHLRL